MFQWIKITGDIMLMKRGALALGLVMLLIGCYFFIVSMIMIMTDSIIDNWMTWCRQKGRGSKNKLKSLFV